MPTEKPNWKENWKEVKQHYIKWWNHGGPVLTFAGLPPLDTPRPNSPLPDPPKDLVQRYTDPVWCTRNERARLARTPLVADTLPLARIDYGTVELSACFGAEPNFSESTVWYDPWDAEPDQYPPLLLTKDEKWFQIYKQVMLELVRVGQGDFIVGAPNLTPNLDALMELRGTQNLLFDLIERPEWVKEKLGEINQSFFTAFDEHYPHILCDGGTSFTSFHIWGPGKTSQVQCDFAAMISPAMFREFVVPPLQAQCAWLDHSLFHLDGPDAICHLDALLEISELDAVQWVPGAGQLPVGDPKWDHIYRRTLDAGKSAQLLGATPAEARRILDTFGPAGIFLQVVTSSAKEAEDLTTLVDSMRK